MPTYTYQCPGCYKRLERVVKVAERDKPIESFCTQSGQKETLLRVIDAPQKTPGAWYPGER